MDGWVDGWTEGMDWWVGGWVGGRTDGWNDGWKDGRTDGWVGGWIDGMNNECMYGRSARRKAEKRNDGWVEQSMCVCMNSSTEGRLQEFRELLTFHSHVT
jgi:hypothetical protein